MPTQHVSEQMVKRKIVGGLRFGNEQAILVDGDLTSLSAAKAAVDADNAKLHVSQRLFATKVKKALDMVGDYDSTYVTGSSALKSTMTALSPNQKNGAVAPVIS